IDTDSRAFFLQGSWKATDDLTLSAGVRRQSMSTDVSDFVAANQQILIANGLGKTADAVPGGSKDYDVNLVNVGAIYKLNLQQQV
ncbi:TonB-dependent receptor domain-containing protein, partial [Salmonella sp. SAL4441]